MKAVVVGVCFIVEVYAYTMHTRFMDEPSRRLKDGQGAVLPTPRAQLPVVYAACVRGGCSVYGEGREWKQIWP